MPSRLPEKAVKWSGEMPATRVSLMSDINESRTEKVKIHHDTERVLLDRS
jgi:hypothetical protein